MYVSVTVLGTSDVVIKFYVIDICSQEPKKNKTPEEETSPVPWERSEIEEAPLALLSGAYLSSSCMIESHKV